MDTEKTEKRSSEKKERKRAHDDEAAHPKKRSHEEKEDADKTQQQQQPEPEAEAPASAQSEPASSTAEEPTAEQKPVRVVTVKDCTMTLPADDPRLQFSRAVRVAMGANMRCLPDDAVYDLLTHPTKVQTDERLSLLAMETYANACLAVGVDSDPRKPYAEQAKELWENIRKLAEENGAWIPAAEAQQYSNKHLANGNIIAGVLSEFRPNLKTEDPECSSYFKPQVADGLTESVAVKPLPDEGGFCERAYKLLAAEVNAWDYLLFDAGKNCATKEERQKALDAFDPMALQGLLGRYNSASDKAILGCFKAILLGPRAGTLDMNFHCRMPVINIAGRAAPMQNMAVPKLRGSAASRSGNRVTTIPTQPLNLGFMNIKPRIEDQMQFDLERYANKDALNSKSGGPVHCPGLIVYIPVEDGTGGNYALVGADAFHRHEGLKKLLEERRLVARVWTRIKPPKADFESRYPYVDMIELIGTLPAAQAQSGLQAITMQELSSNPDEARKRVADLLRAGNSSARAIASAPAAPA